MKLPQKKSLVVIVAVTVLVIVANRAFTETRSKSALSDLTRQLPTDMYDGMMRFGADTRTQRQQFNAVWAARHQRDITDDILPFLDVSDPIPMLRLEAIQALGRMESPKAQAPIEALLRNEQDSSIPPIHIRLALGRIKSRGLEGQAKVEAMTKEVGLTWGDAIRLSQTLNGKEANRNKMQNTEGEVVMEELTDLLHVMGKQGQKVKPLAEQLTLLPSQQVWVDSSVLDDEQGAKLVLNFLTGLYGIRSEDYSLQNHLVESNPAVADVTLAFLEDMKHNPKKYYSLEPYPGYPGAYRAHNGYSCLMRVAEQTGDKRMLPYFRYFAKIPGQNFQDKWVKSEAEMVLENFNLRAKGDL